MYLTVFISLIVIASALVFGAAMFSIVKSIGQRKRATAAVSPEVVRKHLPLIILISVPNLFLFAALLLLAATVFLGFLSSINPFQRHSAYSEAFSIFMWIVALLLAVVIGAKSVERHRKSETRFFRDLLRVNTDSVSTFAFIFAAFAAHDIYQLNQDFLWIAVFFLGRSCVSTILMRILELNPKAPPQDSQPPDESDSGPTNPFDPYVLPNNRLPYPRVRELARPASVET